MRVQASTVKKLNFRNILVPTDFSKMSIQVIESVKWLAGGFAAAIDLVHVYESGYLAGLVVPSPPFSLTPYEQETKEKVGGELKVLARKYGVPAARCHVLSGTPAFNEICGLAGEIRTDLIVMPTHGRTGLEHSSAARPSERCGTRRVRCLSCANGAMASPKGRMLIKRSLFLSISPIARAKDCDTRSDSRGVSGEVSSATRR